MKWWEFLHYYQTFGHIACIYHVRRPQHKEQTDDSKNHWPSTCRVGEG